MANSAVRRPSVAATALLTLTLGAACSGADDPNAPSIAAAPPSADAASTVAPNDQNGTSSSSSPSTTTAQPTIEPTVDAGADSTAPATTTSADERSAPSAEPAVASTQPAGSTAPGSTAVPATVATPPENTVDWAAIATGLLDRHFLIPREPSFELVREVCLEPSGCFDDAARTVDVLLRDGVRLRGGAPFDIVSVEFQNTVDGAPVDSALAVNLIVRYIATEQGTVELVDGAGGVVSEVETDDRFPPGQPTARAVILGRDAATAGWKLVALSDWM